jgi:hypothetical protein
VKASPIVCVAANDQADEIAATMLAQLLEQRGYKTLLLPVAALSSEILGRLAEEMDTTICISALPPFAFVHARNLCQRVRQHLPQNRIVIGLWGETDERGTLRERFGAARPDVVATTLVQAIRQVRRIPETTARSTATERAVSRI